MLGGDPALCILLNHGEVLNDGRRTLLVTDRESQYTVFAWAGNNAT